MYQPLATRYWPEIWLMTDERNDHCLEESISALPSASGIVFRHSHLPETARRYRFMQIKSLAKKYGHLLMLAGAPALARSWGADGVHGRQWRRSHTAGLFHSAPVHNIREIRAARQNGADIFFLSPAYATQSHPGQKPLHKIQLRNLINLCGGPVVLLGGMTASRFAQFQHLEVQGWAAIDGLVRGTINGSDKL